MRILSTNPPEGKSKNNLRTDAQRGSAGLGLVTARSAHATPEAVVRRERHLLLADSGDARNVAENPPAFVYSRGRKIVAGRDATHEAVDALTRHAEQHARETSPAPTWGERRAA